MQKAIVAELLGTLLFQFLVGFSKHDALAAGLSYAVLRTFCVPTPILRDDMRMPLDEHCCALSRIRPHSWDSCEAWHLVLDVFAILVCVQSMGLSRSLVVI